MHTSVVSNDAIAVDVSCSSDALTVVLDDGRTVSVPLAWFPRLLSATEKQRREWEFIGGGIGIHGEEIDEDISVASLLNPEKFMRLANSYEDAPVKKTKSGPALKKRTTGKSANKDDRIDFAPRLWFRRRVFSH